MNINSTLNISKHRRKETKRKQTVTPESANSGN
jgi:hypothetical protein